MYLLGLDGGETKTHCIIGDKEGNICAEGFGGPANYQLVGEETAKKSIETAISRALNKLNIKIKHIELGIIGLSGADCKEDFEILNRMCKDIFQNVPFKIYNDCWLVLRAGNEENWGVVSVCDRGHGCMGRTKTGEKVELRNMVYMMGNKGGGTELIYEILHHTFRADEKVGPPTKLQEEIPKLFGVGAMCDVDHLIREKGQDIEGWNQIPGLVYRLAKEEDMVSQELIISMGHSIGRTAAAVIRRLGLQQTEVPIVLGGSAFTEDNPLFMDAYKMEVHRVAPHAKFHVIDKKPVIGAYHLAMDCYKENFK